MPTRTDQVNRIQLPPRRVSPTIAAQSCWRRPWPRAIASGMATNPRTNRAVPPSATGSGQCWPVYSSTTQGTVHSRTGAIKGM